MADIPHSDPPGFVHLRVHSAYSLAEGAIGVKQLVKLCLKNGMPAVAITDTNNMFGTLEFALAAAEAGLQPIIGCQIALSRADTEAKTAAGLQAAPDQLVLLAQTEAGYKNLQSLASRAYLETNSAAEPQLALADLAGFTDGLIALTGGPMGWPGRLLRETNAKGAQNACEELAKLFPGRLYIEIQRHESDGPWPTEAATETGFLAIADTLNLPLVATNECFFADTAMHQAHDALLCIAEGRYVTEESRRRVTADHWFKPVSAMRELFADLPEAIENTVAIAKRCSYMPGKIKPILPPFPGLAEGRTEEAELRAQAEAGLMDRLAKLTYPVDAETYKKRLAYELDTIVTMGFAGYFLITSDFIKWAKAQNIPVGPGRGSGAGSVVAWSLLITDLDPLRFGLLFERFLNPERVSMPDFDIDFCQERRDEVIHYVQKRYGHDRVAQIITFGKLQARAVLRDVGRVLQMSYGQVDRLCKLVPQNPANPVTLEQAIESEQQLQDSRDQDPEVARLIGIALKLEGLYRHASTHAAGVVIGDRPLSQLVPLYRDPRSDIPATQFNMKTVELAGLVKFDFLGLKTLTVIQEALNLLKSQDITLDIAHIPLDDPKTFAMLAAGDTTGVFQLESSGMRDVGRKMKLSRFEEIIALVAMYRPGPMDNIPKYIAVKHGEDRPDYLHPLLEPILKETYGIPVYQEQVIQIAQTLAGYTLGGADLLRRAMGKKIKEEMAAQRTTFITGAKERGVDESQAEQIFEQVDKFAGYGFNKSHAAAYALISYQTAYLKANHPLEFFAASMTLDLGNTDKLNIFRQELQRLGIKLLPPDINRSRDIFTVETLKTGERVIRYALGAIKGVGRGAMQELVRVRTTDGPFKDVTDFANRLDGRVINKRLLENLTAAGALDCLLPNRAQMMGSVETITRHSQSVADEKASGQVSLFGALGNAAANRITLAAVPAWDRLTALRHEFEAIGFYLSAHPLDSHRLLLERLGTIPAAKLSAKLAGGGSARLKLAGILIGKQERTAKSGNRFAFAQFSDPSGVFEVLLFSELLATSREILVPGTSLLLTVELQLNGEEFRLTTQGIELLEQATSRIAQGFLLRIGDATALPALKEALTRCGAGKSRIMLAVDIDAEIETRLDLTQGWNLPLTAEDMFKALPGISEVARI